MNNSIPAGISKRKDGRYIVRIVKEGKQLVRYCKEIDEAKEILMKMHG